MNRKILYLVFMLLVGSCSVHKAHKPRTPVLPWKRKPVEAKVEPKVEAPVEAAPEPAAAPSPQCTCEKCKCDPCVCKAEVCEAPKATGRWVLVNQPVYGGFRGRQFQGYRQVWQWQGSYQPAAAACSTCR